MSLDEAKSKHGELGLQAKQFYGYVINLLFAGCKKICRRIRRPFAYHLRPTEVKHVEAGDGSFHPMTVPFVEEVIKPLINHVKKGTFIS